LRSVTDASIDAARRVTGTDRELAGRLILNVDDDDDAVGLRTGRRRNFDRAEIAETLEALTCTANHGLVEGIAFRQVEFAADDVVASPGVTADFNALDIGARALVDEVADRDRAVCEIAIATRRDLSEREAGVSNALGNRNDRVFDVFRAVGRAGTALNERLKLFGVHVGNGAFNIDRAEVVTLAFLDGDRDRVFVGCRIELGEGRYDLEVRVATVVIEAAQQFFVRAQLVFGVNVTARQERQKVRALRRDHFAKAAIIEGLVADEIDRRDTRTVAFVDFESEVDAAIGERDRIGRYRGIVSADRGVSVADRLNVSLNERLAVGSERLGLDDALKLAVADAAIAVEDHLIEDLVFGNRNDERPTLLGNADVGEQAGGEQATDGFVDIGVREVLTWANGDVAANGLGIDAAVALHLDAVDDCRLCGGRCTQESNTRSAGCNSRG
jgi:hypothetical protein